uniref:Uncharacterized protein n=1 Tax=Anguilla anguilla TaxID=7936 RepID=A0A0E9RQB9_ANGAN
MIEPQGRKGSVSMRSKASSRSCCMSCPSYSSPSQPFICRLVKSISRSTFDRRPAAVGVFRNTLCARAFMVASSSARV